MQSFILTGGTASTRAQYIGDLLQSDQSELIHIFAEKSSISIKQIQDLTIPLSISARLPRIVWIEEAELMTIPAQNALLKMLEEPPSITNFYLTCDSASSLLPTIRSRTKVMMLTSKPETPNLTVLTDLKAIMAMTPGNRLAAIVKRDRAESVLWISQIESALKDKLRSPGLGLPGATTLAKIAKSAQNAHSELLANCSVGLVTQHFYLTLPHTHSAR